MDFFESSIEPNGELEQSAPIHVLIENGEEAQKIYQAIVYEACKLPAVLGGYLVIPSDSETGARSVMAAQSGDVSLLPQVGDLIASPVEDLGSRNPHGVELTSGIWSFEVVCLSAPIGSLMVSARTALSADDRLALSMLAHHSGVVLERHRLSGNLQHFIDRLEVLNELNQLIATNVALPRIAKSVSHECAFRFAADISLVFVIDDETQKLQLRGGYGCAPTAAPKEVTSDEGLLGQMMRAGGLLTIRSLANYPEHKLEFLTALNIRTVDLCCLEVRGQAFGVLVMGYRRENTMTQNDVKRFEEFCQGAAVAISNARAQERLTAYTERLEEIVAQRTADLAVQTARAEDANNAKSQFLANMSHELRTPLTAIVGYSSVLADGIFGPLSDKQKEALGAVTRSSEHLKNLIDDVLNLARIESGKEEAEARVVNTKDLVTQIHKLMLQTAIGKGVQIKPIELPLEILETQMYVDAKHVQQILINLMSNAVKYTPKGGSVWITAEKHVDKLKISVHDTGVGLSPEKQAKLFERFERGEDAYSKSQEGTGIGLHLTKRLVELNGGLIGVESEIGKGSVFWLMMPLASAAADAIASKEQSAVGMRIDGLSTVVVDDNKDTCDVLRVVLEAAGASVRVASSVKEGLSLIYESRPDVVLTDLAMPGDNGLVLIQKLKDPSSDYTGLPIIVLSACAFEGDRQSALEAGASLFLAKPFKPSEVVRSIRNVALASAMQGN